MSFRNPILAGNTLVRAAIQSTNYAAGSAGWMIGRDGTAEFNAATFRGTVVVQSNQAVLFYSGVPAAGNLVLAISPVAGTDSFGNGYSQGLTIGSAGGFEIVLGLTGGSPLMFFPTGNVGITNSSALQAITQGTGNAEYDQLQILGAQNTTQKDAVDSAWASSSTDGTQPAQILDFYHDPSGGFHFYRTLGFAGNSSIGPSTAVNPTTGLSRANPAVAETWHSVTPATGWTITGLSPGLSCRLLPDGNTQLEGSIKFSSGTPTSGALMCTLPAAYRPPTGKFYLTPTASGVFLITIATTGNVTISNWAGFTLGATPSVYISYTFPLNL